MEIERLQALLNENAIDWTDWSAESQSKNSSNVTV
jgi:aconitase B